MKIKPIISVAIFLLAEASFSQGIYLKRGETGAGIVSKFGFQEQYKGFSIAPGFSFKGMLDISGGYSKVFFDEKVLDRHGSEQSYSNSAYEFTLETFPVKQNDAIPFSVSIKGGYSYIKPQSKALDVSKILASGHVRELGISVLINLAIKQGFEVIPRAGYSFAQVTTNVWYLDESFRLGPDVRSNDDLWMIHLGVDFESEMGSEFSYVYFYHLSIDDGSDASHNLGLGVLFKM